MEKKLSLENLPTAVNQLFQKLENIEQILIDQSIQNRQEQPDQLLTIDEAAELLHLSKPTVYSKVSRGELPVMKRSKRLYFSRVELMNYLKAGRKKPISEIQTEAENYLNTKNQ